MKKWTKEDDNKLKLLDYYGVTVADMAKILDTTYNAVNARLRRLGIDATTQVTNDSTFSEERLALPHIREGICLMYIDHIKASDPVAYTAKACGFRRSQVEMCLAECHTDGTYKRVLQKINNHAQEVGEIGKGI